MVEVCRRSSRVREDLAIRDWGVEWPPAPTIPTLSIHAFVTAFHLSLLASGYVVKAAVTLVLWRRYGGRVQSIGRLARRRRAAGRPVLARATPGHVARTFRLGPPERLVAPAEALAEGS